MTLLITLLTNRWTYVALVALALLGLFGSMRYQIQSLRDQRAALQETVNGLKGELAISKKETEFRDKSITALQNSVREERSRNLIIEGELDAIRKAPKASDGPVAPVLSDTLKRLDGILQK